MPEIYRDIQQNTPEWDALRLASIGGSSINDILAGGKGRKNRLYQFAGERMSGVKKNNLKLWQFERGHLYEPEARDWYEFMHSTVETVGLITGDIAGTHVSPDGLVDPDGSVEIKIREPHVFAEMLDKNMPIALSERRQINHMFWVSGIKWCDHIDYCPEWRNKSKAGWVRTVEPDMEIIRAIREETARFLKELDELVERLS